MIFKYVHIRKTYICIYIYTHVYLMHKDNMGIVVVITILPCGQARGVRPRLTAGRQDQDSHSL